MSRQLSAIAMTLSLLSASGCQAPMPLHQLKQPLFVLSGTEPAVPVVGAARPASTQGQLTVNFAGELARLAAGRRILATLADVEKVVVTVKPAIGAEVSQEVLSGALAGGQTSVTFNGLPAGDALITITALDAAGSTIGTATKTAVVTASQVATVDVVLQLAPTYTGGSGGSGSATGGLTTNVTVVDGLTVNAPYAGAEMAVHQLGFTPYDVEVDSQGNVWVSGADMSGTPAGPAVGRLVKLSPAGDVLALISQGTMLKEIVRRSQDAIWAVDADPDHSVAYEVSSGGQVVQEFAIGSLDNLMSGMVDAADSLHLIYDRMGGGSHVRTLSTTGSLSTYDATTGMQAANLWGLASGVHQDFWVANTGGPTVARYTSSWQFIAETTLPINGAATQVAVDGAGNAWATVNGLSLTDTGGLVKLSPQGQVLDSYVVPGGNAPGHLAIDAGGVVWVSNANQVTRFASDGTVLNSVTPSTGQILRIAVGRSGAWGISHQLGSVVRFAP